MQAAAICVTVNSLCCCITIAQSNQLSAAADAVQCMLAANVPWPHGMGFMANSTRKDCVVAHGGHGLPHILGEAGMHVHATSCILILAVVQSALGCCGIKQLR